MKIIWEVQKRRKLEWWALENPFGLLRRFLGNPYYIFDQRSYGNYRTKRTDLLGRFTVPKRTLKEPPLFLSRAKQSKLRLVFQLYGETKGDHAGGVCKCILQSKPMKTLRPYQFAKRDGVSVHTVYRMIREGKIPADKYRKVTVTVERIEIDEDVKIEKRQVA